MLNSYIERLMEAARKHDATEPSYYPALKTLLEDFAASTNRKKVEVTSNPKRTEAGNPDFRVWDGKKIVGYLEAKAPEEDLDPTEKKEQIVRYRKTFPNFILTDFFEFRLFRNGSLIDKVRIADPESVRSIKGTPQVENEEQFGDLLEKFFSLSLPGITTAQSLARELAKRTRFLRDEVIAEQLREELRSGTGRLFGFYKAFQTYLIRGLKKEQFADLYSQTITYGLFASRMRCEKEFNRKLAVHDIPHSIGILREIFEFISLGDLPHQLEWIVDEISSVLANVDVKGIFSEYSRARKGEDPVFHFYETFLAEYDPEEREKRGVYYTPEAVVSYIVRSLHGILKEKFGLEEGLADDNVTILDPAGGTLTFLAEAIKQAAQEFVSRYGEGGKESLIKEHIMRDFYAFELMVAPYTIGHLKLSFLLDELGHVLKEDERMKFYLTNTLELEEIEQTALPGMASLAEESQKAGEVKKRTPILVILGNPPYSGISANMGEWITGLIEDYKYVDGKHFGEKKHWLQNDYVKFIRFAEWKIGQVGKGVVGYITSHSYLDGPTYRGMRQHLMKTFDEIYVLDLHGSARKKETTPDGSKDENVFDIEEGVCIAFLVKREGGEGHPRRVFHGDLWGLRKMKYEWLSSHTIDITQWEEIHPHSPTCFFVPREEAYEELYDKYWGVAEIFPVYSVGIVTARDKLTIQYTADDVWKTIQDFSDLSEEAARGKYELGRDARDWKVSLAQKDLKESGLRKDLIVPILYRPFDIRYTYYTGHSKGFIEQPLHDVSRHMLKDNLSLLVHKREELHIPYAHFFVSNTLSEHCCVSIKTTCYQFPLYLYSDKERKENAGSDLARRIRDSYSDVPSGKAIFNYVYAVVYSSIYRSRYAELLRTGFPKVPITSNHELFLKLCKLGEELVNLHLLKFEEPKNLAPKFQGDSNNTVEQVTYDGNMQRVCINKMQYFEKIENKVWEYRIGSYQVLEKWLKDRRGRKLSLEEIRHYCKVVTAVKRTIEIQGQIDKYYPSVEKDIIEFTEHDNNQNKSLTDYTE